MADAAIELIKFAATKGPECEDVLVLWLAGEFKELKEEFPDIPEACFAGCDPEHPLSTADPVQTPT